MLTLWCSLLVMVMVRDCSLALHNGTSTTCVSQSLSLPAVQCDVPWTPGSGFACFKVVDYEEQGEQHSTLPNVRCRLKPFSVVRTEVLLFA